MKKTVSNVSKDSACPAGISCPASSGNPPTYWEQKCAIFEEENKVFEKGQTVFIGDSITDGYDLDKYFSPFNLPCKLYNRGISSDTTDGLLRRLDLSLFDIEPDRVVILIGINDLKNEKSAEYVLTNYREILDRIKSRLPRCEIFIQSVYPVNGCCYAISGSTPRVLEVNKNLENIAAEYGCRYLNVFPVLKTAENLLDGRFADDGLHPNEKGYEVITEYLIAFLMG